MKRLIGLSLLLCVVAMAGCAYETTYTSDELNLADGGMVAVLPFENLAGHPNAGLIVAEFFQAQLYDLAKGELDIVLAETVAGKLAPLEGKAMSPREVGELLGAQLLVVGRVAEYAYKHGLGEDPAVGLSVRLLDARTGKVLWSGARSNTGRYSWVKQDSVSRMAQVICGHLARDMMRR